MSEENQKFSDFSFVKYSKTMYDAWSKFCSVSSSFSFFSFRFQSDTPQHLDKRNEFFSAAGRYAALSILSHAQCEIAHNADVISCLLAGF
jgi:hypothetical protein